MSSINILRMRSLKAVKVSSEMYSEQLAESCRTRYGIQMHVKLIHKAHSIHMTNKNHVVSQSQKYMVVTLKICREVYFRWSSLQNTVMR